VSERQTPLSDRSLRYVIQQAGTIAGIPFPIHPYMLRNSGLYYRSALLLEHTHLSLRQSCLLWNWHGTKVEFSPQMMQDYNAIGQEQEDAFLAAIKQLRAFSGIGFYENVVDYLLGAYLLFPKLKDIPSDYWLAPVGWI
jgi:type 1 fimbriae regulatory protein FimB